MEDTDMDKKIADKIESELEESNEHVLDKIHSLLKRQQKKCMDKIKTILQSYHAKIEQLESKLREKDEKILQLSNNKQCHENESNSNTESNNSSKRKKKKRKSPSNKRRFFDENEISNEMEQDEKYSVELASPPAKKRKISNNSNSSKSSSKSKTKAKSTKKSKKSKKAPKTELKRKEKNENVKSNSQSKSQSKSQSISQSLSNSHAQSKSKFDENKQHSHHSNETSESIKLSPALPLKHKVLSDAKTKQLTDILQATMKNSLMDELNSYCNEKRNDTIMQLRQIAAGIVYKASRHVDPSSSDIGKATTSRLLNANFDLRVLHNKPIILQLVNQEITADEFLSIPREQLASDSIQAQRQIGKRKSIHDRVVEKPRDPFSSPTMSSVNPGNALENLDDGRYNDLLDERQAAKDQQKIADELHST